MGDRDFKKTEYRLYNYYQSKEKISHIEYYTASLNRNLEGLENVVKSNFYTLKDNLKAVDYSREAVQTSNINSIDNELVTEYQKVERQMTELRKRILKASVKKSKLLQNNIDIEKLIEEFNQESKQIIEFRYNKNYSFEEIARITYKSKTNVFEKRKLIVLKIANNLNKKRTNPERIRNICG